MNIFELIIVQPIFNLLIALYALIPGGDFGIALIVFTIIVRFAMWPLLKKQLHQTRTMQKLQPQLAKIKKNSGGDKKLESMQTLELYKKHNVSPFRSIGILLIQLPIFIALYQVILMFTSGRDKIAHFTYDFLKNLPSIDTLIADPSKFNEHLFGFIDLTARAIGPEGINFILVGLAVLAAYTQRVMSKQTMPKTQSKRSLKEILSEASNGKEASQAEINGVVMGKMVTFMPFFMFFIMINLPGALALYYAVSNLVAVIQQHMILKKDVEEMEEIAEEVVELEKTKPKTSAKTREKNAKKANVTRIVAKDNKRGRK